MQRFLSAQIMVCVACDGKDLRDNRISKDESSLAKNRREKVKGGELA